MHEHTDPYRMDDNVATEACAARGAKTERSRAALMGVSVSTMRRWREGGTPPRLDVVDMVCRNLGVTPEDLFPHLMSAPDLNEARQKTQADLISEAANRIVAGWPSLTEEERRDFSLIMAGINAELEAVGAAPKSMGRAA